MRARSGAARAIATAVVLLAWPVAVAAVVPACGSPVDERAVYDVAGVLRPEVVAELEERIDAIEGAVGAETAICVWVDPDVTEDQNLANARELMDAWGIGRAGFDDGLVMLVGLQPNRVNGKVSLYGGSGFLAQHIDEAGLDRIIQEYFVPRARDGDLNGAVSDAMLAIQEDVAPDTVELTAARLFNAVLGLIVAPIALVASVGSAWWTWRREGDDPQLTDSPSILMAGPPADMTPALATVLREGRATGHTTNTLLAELASTGRLTFHNLDRVGSARSDDEPDPLTDPAMEVHVEFGDDRLAEPQLEAWRRLRELAGTTPRLSRTRLWMVNGRLGPVGRRLEEEAVRLGWLARLPGPAMRRMTGITVGLLVVGAGAIWLGVAVPLSGAVMLGGALVLGAAATFLFGRAMSQRTPSGAYVDAMLTAYRRTLRKTMEQARSMAEVVEDDEVKLLADTPDKAVVWGLALGLHDEVAAVLARGLEARRDDTGSPAGAYYPRWIGSTPGAAWSAGPDAPGGISPGSGSIFSGSAVPDIGGMLSALGSVGSTPPSSSSSSGGGGGGFSGGGGGGGGGSSGSF